MEHRKLIHVYKASAGAGKTYTLAAEFIANLLNDFKTAREPHRHQLAITFTRKATTEMKERILENLYELAHHVEEQANFLQAVRKKLVVEVSDREISLMARSLLRQILHGYDRFHVNTIDAFFQSLLSNLAHELGLTATFKVDLNNDDLLSRGVEKMLQDLQPDSQELQWVSRYIEQKMEDEPNKSWRVEGALTNLAKELTKESYVKQRHLLQNISLDNALADRYRKTLRALKRNAIGEIQEDAEYAHRFIEETEGYGRISRGGDVEKYLHRAMKYEFSKTDPSKTAVKIANDADAALKKADKAAYADWAVELSNRLEKLFATIDNSAFTINSCDLTLKHFNELRLLDAISASVQEINTENDTFLLAYTPILFAEMVGDSEASFVFERAGTQFNHVMIDEFQDTSELQWKNLQNLFIENIAQGNSCMLVGDVKQGIYRWRGGDWSGLAEIEENEIIDIQTLDSNFRSGEKIVHFNNAVFVKMAQVIAQQECADGEASTPEIVESLLTSLYAEDLVAQKPVRKHGFVRILIEKPKKKEDKKSNKKEDANAFPDEVAAQAEETDEFSAEDELREQIMRLYYAGVPFDKMGVLVRNNKDSAKIIEYFSQYAQEHADDPDFVRIDLVSDEAYLLSASRGVQLIIKALQYIHNPTDEVALEYVLKHCPSERMEAVKALLSEWTGKHYQLLPFYDLIQRLIQHLSIQNQSGEAAYLYTLLDNVVAFLDDNAPDVGRFLQVWEESLQRKAVPSSVVKGVRILTIHKSKGLDFHSVFIPYCNWELVSSDLKQPMIWATPQEVPFNEIPLLPVKLTASAENSIYKEEYLREVRNQRIENLNLLYVAFTRARQNLVICAPRLSRNYDRSIVPAMLQTIEQLPWNEKFAGEARLENDDDRLLLEISQPSIAECAPEVKEKVTATVEVAQLKSDNPFKINAITEEIFIETATHDIRFRQSQQARLFNATLMEAAEAEEQQKVSENGGENSEISTKKSELLVQNSEALTATPVDNAEFLAKRAAAQRRGTLLHSLMEDIESHDDVERVLQTFAREGKIAPVEEVGELRKLLHHAMQHEIVRDWFDGSWRLYRECTILTRDEQGNVHTPRPDRVMMRGDEAIVVDYKFGRSRPDYHEQVRYYCQLLQQMGKKHVKGYLWYVASDVVEAVSL